MDDQSCDDLNGYSSIASISVFTFDIAWCGSRKQRMIPLCQQESQASEGEKWHSDSCLSLRLVGTLLQLYDDENLQLQGLRGSLSPLADDLSSQERRLN